LESCGASHGIPQFHGDSSGIRIKKILLGSKNILLGLNKLLSGSKKTILGEGRKEGRKEAESGISGKWTLVESGSPTIST
jgi:hypothetical protein